MNVNLYNNYIYTRKLNLDVKEQKDTSYKMYDYINDNFTSDEFDYSDTSTLTTKLYSQYNYLLYPYPGIGKLYNGIRETFYSCYHHMYGEPVKEEYHMQCWLNFYKTGDFIDWHQHWDKEYDSWHGFYCVDVEPNSETIYHFHDGSHPNVHIKSENDLLVIGLSGRDSHRSSEWNESYPRITIAFDIIPTRTLNVVDSTTRHIKNHWVPL